MSAATGVPIDVVVATRNRPHDLVRLLHALTLQEHCEFRVVVIDQSELPDANAAAVAALDDHRFVHVPTASRGKSRALNEAIAGHTSAPWLAFTDDDCEPAPDWLTRVERSIARHAGAAIIFGQLVAIPHDPDETFVPAIEFTAERTYDRPLWRSHGLLGMGADMVVPRATFARLGLFDEDLGPGGVLFTGEECELTYRALDAGGSIVQDPSIRIVHWGARPWDGGLAERVQFEGFYANIAGHGKHARAGDWRGLAIALHEAWLVAKTIAATAVTGRRPLHLRRLVSLGRAFWAGFRRGPAWPSLVDPARPATEHWIIDLPPIAPHPEADSLDLTVAICSRNRRDSLLVTIDSLARQKWDGSWELLVIDNDSDDGSAAAALARSGDFPVPLRVVTEPTRGVSYARNRALAEARGRALVYADDDVTCREGWLEAHGQALGSAACSGTGGPILPSLPEGSPEWLSELAWSELGGPTARYDLGPEPFELVPSPERPAPFTANAGVDTEAARTIGGFRTDLGDRKKLIPSEDLDFYHRLTAAGHRLAYIPDAVVDHRIDVARTTPEYYFRWQRGFGRSLVLLDPPQGIYHWCRRAAKYTLWLADAQRGMSAARSGTVAERMAARRERERAFGALLQLAGA